MTDEERKTQIAALLRELEGYERYSNADRAKQVKTELSKLGHQAKTPAKRAERL